MTTDTPPIVSGAGERRISFRTVFAAGCVALFLAACVSDFTEMADRTPMERTGIEGEVGRFDVPDAPALARGRLVGEWRHGTAWRLVGRIPQGSLYRSMDAVLTLRAGNVHEAFLVVSSDLLRGVYLPVSAVFVPADPEVRVRIDQEALR